MRACCVRVCVRACLCICVCIILYDICLCSGALYVYRILCLRLICIMWALMVSMRALSNVYYFDYYYYYRWLVIYLSLCLCLVLHNSRVFLLLNALYTYIYIRMRWANNHGQYCNILLYITFRFGFVHLQHSDVSKLNTVCALHYKVYCAYTPSNGVMAWLNKISLFRILSVSVSLSSWLVLSL